MPSTPTTRTCPPSSTGALDTASQYSPRTKTVPAGASAVRAWAIWFTSVCSPIMLRFARARITSVTKNMVMSANGTLTDTAVERRIRSSGGPATRNTAPNPMATLDLTAIELGQKPLLMGRDQVEQVIVERLSFGEGFGLTNGLLRQFGVSSALGDQAAQPCGSVVFDFAAHHRVHCLSHQHRGGRARVGAGSHRGDIRRFQQEKTGRSSAPAARPDVGDHGNARSYNPRIDLASRIEQAS